MRLTPLDIYQQEFRKVLRGVDPDEVEDFLERVADDYEELAKENAALKKQIEELRYRLASDEKTDQAGVSEAAAGEDAGIIIREARKEADNLLREARKEAENIIHKARTEADEIRTASEEVPEETFREGMALLLKEAEKKAKEIIADKKMEEMKLRGEISKLQARKEQFLVEYRELLEKHLRFLTEETDGGE